MKTSEVEKVCPFCDRSFPETAIKKHMGIVHLGLNAEDCEDESNEVTAVTQTPVETEFVDIKTELTKLLLNETKDSEVRSKNELFACRQCGQAFPTEEGFQEHIEATHDDVEIHGETSPGNELFNCPQCDKKFTQKNSVYRHQRIIHEKTKFSCRRCGKSFEERRNLITHMEATNHQIKSQFQSITDEMRGKSKHKTTLAPRKRGRPSKADIESRAWRAIEKSEREALVQSEDKDRQPAVVILKRLTSQEIARYMNGIRKRGRPSKAEQERRKACEICKKTFNKNDNLKRHIETVHKKVKNFPCEDCGKEFSSKAILTAHIQSTHKGIRFDCNMCDNTIASKVHLRTHVKVIHEEGIVANLKKCSKCSYSSTRKANLKRHILEVHENQKEKCNFCQKYFGRSQLNRHIKQKHF